MSYPEPLRITLVSIHPCRSPQSVPLAGAFLAAALKNSPELAGRLAITIINLYLEQTARECADIISATGPHLVGFSVYVWNRGLCAATARLLEAAKPQPVLFCGGPEASADQERLLREAPWRFLVHGEGEAPLVTAIKALASGGEIAGIPGTAVLSGKTLLSTPAAEPAALEKIPSPFLAGEIDPAKYSGLLWQLSRGCSFACDFCFDGGGNRRVRRFPLQRVEAELHWLAAKGVSQVFVLDSTFNSDRKRAVSILRLIRKIAPQIHFHFEVRSEFLDGEQAGLFAAITCSLQIGLQSADPAVLKAVGREFNRSDFSAKVNLLNETGAIFGFDLIYGLPGDTLTGFKNSLDFALGLYPNHLDIFPLALLPGTALAARSTELQLRHQPHPPYILLSSPSFSQQEMALAARLAASCDIFYSRGKAVSWFMSMLHPLRMKPSRFFELFYNHAAKEGLTPGQGEELTDETIFKLQTGFITELFTQNRLQKLLPVAMDIITYNHYYAAALLATPPELPDKVPAKATLANLQPGLAGSARLATFNYEILEILEAGTADLRELAATCSRTGSAAVIYPKNGQVLTESLHESYFRLLETMDGWQSSRELAAKLGIPLADATDFLQFALTEGIVVSSKVA